MATSVSVTGQGGIQVSSTTTAIGQNAGSAPPELHGNQWGILRIDIGPRPEERT
jgi:hypothetical protein